MFGIPEGCQEYEKKEDNPLVANDTWGREVNRKKHTAETGVRKNLTDLIFND